MPEQVRVESLVEVSLYPLADTARRPESVDEADPAPAHDPAPTLRREALRGHAAMLAFSAAVSGSSESRFTASRQDLLAQA